MLFATDYLNECITLYDDTITQFFATRYVLIRAYRDDGTLDDACYGAFILNVNYL